MNAGRQRAAEKYIDLPKREPPPLRCTALFIGGFGDRALTPETETSAIWVSVKTGDCGLLCRFYDRQGDDPTYGIFVGWDDEAVLCETVPGDPPERFFHAEKQVMPYRFRPMNDQGNRAAVTDFDFTNPRQPPLRLTALLCGVAMPRTDWKQEGDHVVCRGCWRLGSACGDCRRCTQTLISLLNELTDPEPCRYDHHGYCQSHSLHEKPCTHETAKHVLTTATKRLGFTA